MAVMVKVCPAPWGSSWEAEAVRGAVELPAPGDWDGPGIPLKKDAAQWPVSRVLSAEPPIEMQPNQQGTGEYCPSSLAVFTLYYLSVVVGA